MFAPTDEAFRKLPPGTVDGLLKDKAKLTAILKYHVVSGKVMAKDSFKSHHLRTMEGSELVLDTCDGFKVNNASVIQADIECRNGIIHSIDSVLMPGMGMGTTASMPGSGMAGMSSAGVTSPTMETSSSSVTEKTESKRPRNVLGQRCWCNCRRGRWGSRSGRWGQQDEGDHDRKDHLEIAYRW